MEFAAGQLPAVAQRDSRRGAVRAMTTADPLDATRSVASRERLPDERRCRAHSKRSGERCRRLAIPGGTVCVMHGGAAPQVAAAARLDRNQVSGRTADERSGWRRPTAPSPSQATGMVGSGRQARGAAP